MQIASGRQLAWYQMPNLVILAFEWNKLEKSNDQS